MSKESQRIASRKHYAKDPARAYEKFREYIEANPDKKAEYSKRDNERRKAKLRNPTTWSSVVLPNLRSRAKNRGLDFDIEIEDIVPPLYCPVLGIKLEFGTSTKDRHIDNSPSVDRIDNTKGYIKGNVAVISTRANKLKNNATVEELESVIKYMKRCSNDDDLDAHGNNCMGNDSVE